jgi:hypothetical protein
VLGSLACRRRANADHRNQRSGNALATDEIVAHRNMSLVDTSPTPPSHIEWNPTKTFTWGTASWLISDVNEVKLRWNPTADGGGGAVGAFEPCAQPGTLPKVAEVFQFSSADAAVIDQWTANGGTNQIWQMTTP